MFTAGRRDAGKLCIAQLDGMEPSCLNFRSFNVDGRLSGLGGEKNYVRG